MSSRAILFDDDEDGAEFGFDSARPRPCMGARLHELIAGRFERAGGELFPVLPVFLGIGVASYFALPNEPAPAPLWALAALALLLGALAWRGVYWLRVPALFLCLSLVGFGLAAWRTQMVAAPVLSAPYYGPIEGRVIAVDRSSSDKIRLTLDQVRLRRIAPVQTPEVIRISLHGDPFDSTLIPGTLVATTGYLGPPGGAVEPGGFSFRRLAWFSQLGGVGYTRIPVLAMRAPEGSALALQRFRYRLSQGLRAAIPGETGGFIAAILTGDRSGVRQDTTEALRRSNLAHLLAISGLHMGLLTGVVFAAIRAFLAAIPPIALRYPIRKIAALCALAAASFYLAMSGGNVATQRAFVMAAVMLGAVLLNRRAVSMRSVALAALILLIWRPEAVFSAGFQMSFAATVSLVAVFRGLSQWRAITGTPRTRSWRTRLALSIGSVALCSVVAGLATAPIAAYHFHRFAEYGLIANVLAVPLMGLLVMPAAVASALLWCVGGEGLGLWAMEQGVRWVLWVAHEVSARPDAVRMIASPAAWVLPVLTLSGLFVALWPDRFRLLGLTGVAAALLGWSLSPRPDILIAADGALVGWMTPEGRLLSKPRGAGFIARNWLEADGDGADQATAANRAGGTLVEGGMMFEHRGTTWVHLTGRRGARSFAGHCTQGRIVVINSALPETGQNCTVFDTTRLRETGALAVFGDTITPAIHAGPPRPWNAAHVRRAEPPQTPQAP